MVDAAALHRLDRGGWDVHDDMAPVEGQVLRDREALDAALKLSRPIGRRNVESPQRRLVNNAGLPEAKSQLIVLQGTGQGIVPRGARRSFVLHRGEFAFDLQPLPQEGQIFGVRALF